MELKKLKKLKERNEKVLEHQGLIHNIIRKQFKKHPLCHRIPYEDLVGYGNIGLIEGLNRFDENKGFKISTYVTYWIRRYIYKGINENHWPIRIPSGIKLAAKNKKPGTSYHNVPQKTKQAINYAEKVNTTHNDDLYYQYTKPIEPLRVDELKHLLSLITNCKAIIPYDDMEIDNTNIRNKMRIKRIKELIETI